MSRKVLIGMFMTLDGIAAIVESPDTTPGAGDDVWDAMWGTHREDVDTMLLGRNTFEGWSQFWPTQLDSPDPQMRNFARFSDRIEKIVFSRTLKDTTWSNSRIVRGPIEEEIPRLRALPGKNMIVGGGVGFVQSLLASHQADELSLAVVPSIVGHGRSVFRLALDPAQHRDQVPLGAPDRHDFQLLEARGLKSGVVYLRYGLPAPTRA